MIPSPWLMALSVYLLVAVPITFASALLACGATFSAAARSRCSVRGLGALALCASIINGACAGYLHAIDQKPPPLNATDGFWVVVMIASLVLAAFGLWRVSVSSVHGGPPSR